MTRDSHARTNSYLKLACGGHRLRLAPFHASGKFAGPFLRANKKPAARWEPLSRISDDSFRVW
jgi:hypothetical protein